LLDASLFEHGLGLSRELDARFGRETIAAKSSDVPGHTRGIVPLLAAAGIRFLHIGVDPGCVMPDVPPVFRWRDESGAELIVMYQQNYGGGGSIPGCPTVLAVEHTGDNAGPPSLDAILNDVFPEVRRRYPDARVRASSMDEFVRAILPFADGGVVPRLRRGAGLDGGLCLSGGPHRGGALRAASTSPVAGGSA